MKFAPHKTFRDSRSRILFSMRGPLLSFEAFASASCTQRADAGRPLVKRVSINALALVLISLIACVPTDEDRIAAMRSLAVHCDVPEALILRYYRVGLQQHAVYDWSKQRESRKLIYLSSDVIDHQLIKQSHCVKTFVTSAGFTFNFHRRSPTVLYRKR